MSLKEQSRRFGLKINSSKTKLMGTKKASILLNGNEVEQVKSFNYLGQEIRLPRDHSNEVSRRIRCGWNVFKQYKSVLTNRTVNKRWKRRLFNMCILPAMLYGAETWALTEAAQKKLAAAQRRMERRMTGVRLLDRRTNEWLRSVTKVQDILQTAKRRKWIHAWKIANEEDEKWSKIIMEWRPPKTRPPGRPRTRWRDEITKKLKTDAWQTKAKRVAFEQWLEIGIR
uniref:Endonuclease-reverse transcriptase n=1 Tax=Steinernema glaseri TaxID=37863 RepID=A0A1I7YIQ5_9BILA